MVKGSDIILIHVAIMFPPAAIGFMSGCSADLLINICLTILGFIPGHIHAFWVIYKKMQAEERRGQGGSISDTGSGQHQPRDDKSRASTVDVNVLDVANDVLSATSATGDDGKLQPRKDQRPAATVTNVEKVLDVANQVLSAMGDDGSDQ
ncbi:hypothetical protein L210DRAFT_3528108 [Boletus edulis BED1]|uniref:Plasma membrane proteolipid 3 n=1 Tax=Boletus edulis BED1 TaxID=1328754 RepID=A0AAD4GHL1_BOLED|nr:hypothetical protein L210DRAFT_3528108 [Boletus edulis BED1]